MCIFSEEIGNDVHECIVDCPLCWIFLSPPNKSALVRGDRIPLGTARDLMLAAREGCVFAGTWLDRLLRSKYGSEYSQTSPISAFIPDSSRSPPADIRTLTLSIQGLEGVRNTLGDGVVETIYHNHEDTFGVFAFEGSDTGEFITQRLAQPVVDQPNAYVQARKWIADCAFKHEHCPRPDLNSSLPTRVLDLTSSGDSTVRVHVSQGQCSQYAALSYCWGHTRQTTLTHATFATFTGDEGIEVAKLPRTLRDAITVSRNLGMRYLWIDSLCIIQDSNEDKSIEITKMPEIYKGAIITISAALASDCGDGFLAPREAVQDILNSVFPLEYLLADPNDSDEETGHVRDVRKEDTDTIFICGDADCGYEIRSFDEEPINSRAWTMQESWLSPRILIYGAGTLQWQCLTCAASFGGTPPDHSAKEEFVSVKGRKKFFATETPELDEGKGEDEGVRQQRQVMTEEDLDNLADEWRSLVHSYTQRAMTNPSDKLPALSGIAYEFARLSHDVYLAGLWKRDLPYNLLWYHSSFPPAGSREIEEYRAPSWSWAAIDGGITLKSARKWVGRTEIRVLEAVTEFAIKEAPFAQVTAGHVTLEGPVRRMSWEQVQQRFVIVGMGETAHLFANKEKTSTGTTSSPTTASPTPSSRNPTPNAQYAQPGQTVSVSVYPPVFHTPIPRRISTLKPPSAQTATQLVDNLAELSIEQPERKANEESENEQQKEKDVAENGTYIFLEITRAPEPTGIVMERLGDGTYRRIGFFLMGRRETSEDEERDGFWSGGERDWDWDEGLDMEIVTIV